MATVRTVPSSTLDRWDVKHVVALQWMRPRHQMILFGEVAERRIEINRGGTRYGSVHFDGSITRRPETVAIKGSSYLAYPKDIVFSRIDARNGAVGVIPDQYDFLAFTNEYPIYDVVSKGRLLPDYARLLCRTKVFRSQIQALVVGHTGRKRVSAELFEGMLIPVPSAEEQEKIVSAYQAGILACVEKRAEASSLQADAIKQITELLGLRSLDVAPINGAFVVPSHLPERWSVFAAASAARGIRDELESSYAVQALGSGDLASVAYGISKSPRNRPSLDSHPYLRVANVQDGYLDLREIKYIDVPESQLPMYRLEPGDVLLCEGNSAELVGRPALWHGEIESCVHQNHVLRVRCCRDNLLPEYLLAYMQTAPSRGHFRRRAKKTTNLATINSSDVRELLIPVPPLSVQQAVADVWEDARSCVNLLIAAAADDELRLLAEAEAAIVNGT